MNTKCFSVLAVFLIMFVFGGKQAFPSGENVLPATYSLLLSKRLSEVTKVIVAKQGGTLNTNRISLSIPPGALSEDTEITLRSVPIAQYDRNTEEGGGIANLHIIGAVFEPEGTVLNLPAVVRFSLPSNWENNTDLFVSAANGSNPMDVLENPGDIIITGSAGGYIAEIEVPHFSIFNISRICHQGSVNNTAEKFKQSNADCDVKMIKAQVLNKYNIPIDPVNPTGPAKDEKGDAIKMGKDNIQAYLGTYFDAHGSAYNAGDEITADTIEHMKKLARDGLQVVIAFNTSETWPERDGTHAHNFYGSFPHTANLEYFIDKKTGNESFLVRHTLSVGGFKGGKLEKFRTKMGDVISFTDPLDNINNFRTTANGKLFRAYLERKFPELNKLLMPLKKDYKRSYKSVKIYVDRRNDKKQNACDLNLKDRQNCLCSTGCLLPGTEFYCRYDTEFTGWSPSCRDFSNGPCICTAYGCNRRQMATSGDCYDSCMEKFPE